MKQKDAGKTQKKKKNGKNSDSTPKERLREKKEETVVAHKIFFKQKDRHRKNKVRTGEGERGREKERGKERERDKERERERVCVRERPLSATTKQIYFCLQIMCPFVNDVSICKQFFQVQTLL